MLVACREQPDRTKGVALELISLTRSVDGPRDGRFVLRNNTKRTVEIPVFANSPDKTPEAALVSYKVHVNNRWVSAFVGYDYIPDVYRIPPNSECEVIVNLSRLASPDGVVYLTLEDVVAKQGGISIPFTARIKIGDFYSKPFVIRKGQQAK